jgi:4-hydroxybenzoate polyprenyltransferase
MPAISANNTVNQKMSIFMPLWDSLRPRQWTKNLFIFAGILFSQNIFNPYLLIKTLGGFFVFCILSGAVYLINDLKDVNEDKQHPVKSARALASGRLKSSHAKMAVIGLIPASFVIAFHLNFLFLVSAVTYFLLQLAYSLFLKRVVILDVFTLASGFVLRVVAGVVIIDVEISSWLLICMTLLSLFLALSKRRHELVLMEGEAANHRRVLQDYNAHLLDQMISVVTASTVVAYALYTMSAETVAKFGTKNLVFTFPFVLYGIFRYLYLVHHRGMGGNPEQILTSDRPLMIDISLWVVSVLIILYG